MVAVLPLRIRPCEIAEYTVSEVRQRIPDEHSAISAQSSAARVWLIAGRWALTALCRYVTVIPNVVLRYNTMLKSYFNSGRIRMPTPFSRRMLLQMTALTPGLRAFAAPATEPAAGRSVVSLVKGEERRRNIRQALEAIDRQVLPAPGAEIPERFQRTEQGFAQKLGREPLRDWDSPNVRGPAALHRSHRFSDSLPLRPSILPV